MWIFAAFWRTLLLTCGEWATLIKHSWSLASKASRSLAKFGHAPAKSNFEAEMRAIPTSKNTERKGDKGSATTDQLPADSAAHEFCMSIRLQYLMVLRISVQHFHKETTVFLLFLRANNTKQFLKKCTNLALFFFDFCSQRDLWRCLSLLPINDHFNDFHRVLLHWIQQKALLTIGQNYRLHPVMTPNP